MHTILAISLAAKPLHGALDWATFPSTASGVSDQRLANQMTFYILALSREVILGNFLKTRLDVLAGTMSEPISEDFVLLLYLN